MNDIKITRINKFLKAHAKRCAYCGVYFNLGEGKTIDHIVPKSKGGLEKICNKLVVCSKCNLEKKDKNKDCLVEYREDIIRYLEDFTGIIAPTGEDYVLAIRKTLKKII